jgi:hypothetical protein
VCGHDDRECPLSKSFFQKTQHFGPGKAAKTRIVHGVGYEKVTRARNHHLPRKEAALLQRRQKCRGLGGGIDDIVIIAVDQEETRRTI